MEKTNKSNGLDRSQDFSRQAQGPSPGIVRDFIDLLRYNKKWWLTPIILMLLVVAAFSLLTTTPAAPFIYTLF